MNFEECIQHINERMLETLPDPGYKPNLGNICCRCYQAYKEVYQAYTGSEPSGSLAFLLAVTASLQGQIIYSGAVTVHQRWLDRRNAAEGRK